MASRKKSTSTESSSDSSSNSSSSSGSSSGSDSGSSSSDSESSSSPDEKEARSSSRSNEPDESGQSTQKSSTTDKGPSRRQSDAKPPIASVPTKVDEKPLNTTGKIKNTVGRSQRLSKSSVCSSDDDSTVSKNKSKKPPQTLSDRKKVNDMRKPSQNALQPPINGGGKAPPSVVKMQQTLAKNAKHQQNNHKMAVKQITHPPKQQQDRAKKKSIFSPDNSSLSEDESVKKPNDKTSVIKAKQIPKEKIIKASQRKVLAANAKKKDEVKHSGTSSSCSSDGTSSSSASDDSDSSDEDSSPPAKKPAPRKVQSKGNDVKTVVLSDSESEQSKQPRVRKLTRSASTRKSKHLTGKASDSDSDMDIDKRSISKSPVKKAPIITTKSKAKTKKEVKHTVPLCLATPPIPEEQKCPVEGCDSSGHLGGNLEKHFLPEACPMYHNMTSVEAKERANERKLHEEERTKAIALYDPSKKFITPEQKAYQMKIRESRAKFKPMRPVTPIEKVKTEKVAKDKEREPNLNGLVPDYDLQLFREAQALASEKMEQELKDLPVGKGIKYITMGKYQMKVWYQSPYPEEAARLPKMYICEFCLRYQKSEVGMKRHASKCVWRHPPGDEIYRKGKLQVWQVDGKRHKQYCQHLCLLAKFFLDHKTLYNDVEPFLFYVMTLADSEGCHTVGYFSKEKNSFLNYNVSCILTLPPYQRKGYGRLLIDFSYLLTRVEGKIGSPEKPLSDLGLISYRSYWKDVLLEYLCTRSGTTLSIKDVSQEMAIYSYDIVSTLQALGMMKYWKGKHIILKKQDVLEEFEERVKRRGSFPRIDQPSLRWSPFVPPQSAGSS